MKRREFLRTTAGGLLLAGAPYILGQDKPDKYRIAIIGSGWWGKNILKEAVASKRVKVVGVCDVDSVAMDVAAEQVNDWCGDSPKQYKYHEDLLAKEKPDIVIIATPDHWHALQTIDAVNAGAHVFVEKPTGHTVNESRAMLKAARASGKVVQVGLHRRVGPHHVSAMKFLKSGGVGNVGMVRLFAHGGGGADRPRPNAKAPDTLDWERWIGPAPMRPFSTEIHPGRWRNYLDFSNGTMGDWGVHWLDQVLWWSEEKYPKRIFCTGGRSIAGPVILNDKEQTSDIPDHQVATFEFEKFTCIWEHRRFGENNAEKHGIGAYFYGTKGTLHIGWRDGWTFYPSNRKDAPTHENSELQEPDGHNLALLWANFMDAIEKKEKATTGIEIAHRSSVLPLLGMVSWRLGRSIDWDADKELIRNDPKANELLSRPYRAPWKYPQV
jgi:predicted dehydrogenase